MKKGFLIILSFFVLHSCYASSFYDWIKGKDPGNDVFILPVGFHVENLRPNAFLVFGIRYNSILLSTFKNCWGYQTLALGLNRDVVESGNFNLGYFLGLMYGYHRKLQDDQHIPFHRALAIGNFNPAIGFIAGYKINDYMKLSATLSGTAVALGFGISY